MISLFRTVRLLRHGGFHGPPPGRAPGDPGRDQGRAGAGRLRPSVQLPAFRDAGPRRALAAAVPDGGDGGVTGRDWK